MLLTGIKDGDDVRVIQAPGRFGLAEEALLDLDQLVRLEFLRQAMVLMATTRLIFGSRPR
jgi:hypothetical protein